MNTVKITVTLLPYASWMADLLTAEMAALGFDTFVETGNGFEAFIPENLYSEKALGEVTGSRAGDFAISWSCETIAARNWNEEWEKNYFTPLVIGDRVVVRAPFHASFPECPIEIVIEPKMAFGTGNHETTALMMELMITLPMKGWEVLDMGCGTGILAILAARLGAAAITAIDIDPWSFSATSENILLNATPEVTPLLGDAALLGQDTYHLVLANIQKNIILGDLEKYAAILRPGGLLLVSGFFTEDLPDIRAKAQALGLTPGDAMEKNRWTAARFSK